MSLQPLSKWKVRQGFERAAHSYDKAAVLQRQVADEMLSRLQVLHTRPARVLDLGCGTGYSTRLLARHYRRAHVIGIDLAHAMTRLARARRRWWANHCYFVGDAELLPFADASMDIVVSNLTLQWCRPDPVFSECLRVLRPGGVMLFSSFGPDTLKELRQAWQQVDGGIHVHDFIDMHDLGDAMLRAGFAEPVMDIDRYTLTYSRVSDVLRDLRDIGAANAAARRSRGLLGRQRYQQFYRAYEGLALVDGRVPATYEVVYGHAWVPETEAKSAPGIQTVALDEIGRIK